MADVNVNAPADQAPTMAPPTRTDDQILPYIRWVPIGKSNCNLDVERSQSNPIYKIARKHKFHLRPDSPLHLPNEEHVLGYLKFSAKGTKREVFGTPILDNLITTDIQGEPYYKEYLEKVAKYQRYLAGEKRSDPESPASKPAKATKKSKPSAPKVDLRPPVIKQASSQQPEPKPAPAKSQGKKRKLVKETSDKPSPARRSKPGFDDEEADVQRALEESLKSVYDEPWGPLPPVVIREPESGKYQPLPEVQGKGKEKVIEEHVALDLLTLQTPKKKSPADYPVVHAGPNLEHMDLEAMDVSTHPHPEQMDEGFTATAYLKVHENLKLTVEEHVILEEPASSTGTLSSLQHLAKDLSFGDLFFNDKPFKADNEKTTAKTKAKSMVSVIIQQDMSSIPPMTTPMIDLTSRPDSPNVHRPLQATATETTTTTTTTIHPPPPQPQQSTTYSMLMKRIGELEHIMANLIQDNKHLEERLDSHGVRLYTLENLDIPQQKSINRDHTDELLKDLAEARKKKKKRRDSPKTPPGSPPHQPPPPPPLAGPSGTLGSPGASGSSQIAALVEYKAWTMTDTRLRLSVSSTPKDLHMDDDMAPNAQVHSSNDEDIRNAYIPKTGDMAMFMDWFCKRQGITEVKPQDLEGPAFELVKVFHPNLIHLQYQMEECHKLLTDSVDDSIIRHNVSKPLPLGGLPSQVTIQSDFFFNKDLEYLRYGSKGSRPALSISKMKAAYYPDVGLEQMVPDQMWIEEDCKYDIAATYGISHWWFQRQRFYIDKHTSKGDRRAVRTHMRILSVVRIEVFSMYGYDYMKNTILRRADLNEHIISKRDFKYLYPSDFEVLYLLNLQGHLNYLPPKDKKILTTVVNLWTKHLVIRQRVEDFQLGIESYQTQLNLTKPQWDATSFEYKHDYTIDEALDYRVKEFKVNRMNLGLNIRFWTRKDVDRSKEFMFAIQKRLKTRRIFRNLESFVGGRTLSNIDAHIEGEQMMCDGNCGNTKDRSCNYFIEVIRMVSYGSTCDIISVEAGMGVFVIPFGQSHVYAGGSASEGAFHLSGSPSDAQLYMDVFQKYSWCCGGNSRRGCNARLEGDRLLFTPF
nr:histone deacetylase 14 [Tanacetum cinerariifolium]